MYKIVIIMAYTTYLLMADVGCNVLIDKKNQTCQESTILNQEKKSPFKFSQKFHKIR